MTDQCLTALLAERVMDWKVSSDRFLTGDRGWMPRWRFQPEKQVSDALQLLVGAAPQAYTIVADEHGEFAVQIQVSGRTVKAVSRLLPLAITLAVARAIGIDELPEDAE